MTPARAGAGQSTSAAAVGDSVVVPVTSSEAVTAGGRTAPLLCPLWMTDRGQIEGSFVNVDADRPKLRQIVLDTTNARASAEFWRGLLGLVYRPGHEPPPDGQTILPVAIGSTCTTLTGHRSSRSNRFQP